MEKLSDYWVGITMQCPTCGVSLRVAMADLNSRSRGMTHNVIVATCVNCSHEFDIASEFVPLAIRSWVHGGKKAPYDLSKELARMDREIKRDPNEL
jgi:hypothetical protein